MWRRPSPWLGTSELCWGDECGRKMVDRGTCGELRSNITEARSRPRFTRSDIIRAYVNVWGLGMSRIKRGLIALALVLAVVGIVWVVVFKKDSDLLDACQRCDAAEVERLLARGANPNAQRKRTLGVGTTALMLAASCDKVPDERPLLQLPVEPIGDPKIVKLLLAKGADLNKGVRGGGTVLHYAVGNPTLHEVESPGPHPRPAPGNPEVIRTLLEAGADVNANLGHGYTPLSVAFMCNFLPFRPVLDSTSNLKGEFVCMNRDCIRVLIEHGATSNSGDKCEDMWVISDCGLHELLELFIQRGCDANVNHDWPNKENPYVVVQLAARGRKDAVKRLLEITPKVDEEIMAWAVYYNCMDLVKDLLDRGMNVNCRSKWDSNLNRMLSPTRVGAGMPIIYIAAARGDAEMTNLLIEWGADVNARSAVRTGWGALDAALSAGHYRVAEILRSHGAQQYGEPRPR
jgi:ankyrin repeat protein